MKKYIVGGLVAFAVIGAWLMLGNFLTIRNAGEATKYGNIVFTAHNTWFFMAGQDTSAWHFEKVSTVNGDTLQIEKRQLKWEWR